MQIASNYFVGFYPHKPRAWSDLPIILFVAKYTVPCSIPSPKGGVSIASSSASYSDEPFGEKRLKMIDIRRSVKLVELCR